ncbi:MAG: choline/carnitine O-acyltransferase [Anaerolineae bacterium]|nr:choline/carnitine O-acyltransferase [Anaerolineae bacterium]
MVDDLTRDEEAVQQATQMTATNLRKLMSDTADHKSAPSHISVPEREELIELVSQILPAGNVVGFVLSGIMHLKDRAVPAAEGRTHLSSLFKGLAIMRNNAFYRMMFAGPATVLLGYNMLLRLAGAKPEDYMPDGVWQFYVEFGLREDAARHNNETLGFQQTAKKLLPVPSDIESLTAWTLASMWLLRDYDYLLANIWEEHVRLTVIEETTGLTRLHRAWQSLRPFSVPSDQLSITLSAYRRQRFDVFCAETLDQVGKDQYHQFETEWNNPQKQQERQRAIQDYQHQLSIRSYLSPGEYSEKRERISSSDMHIGVIYRDTYHLIKFIDPTSPTAPTLLHNQIQTILQGSATGQSSVDRILTLTPRIAQSDLRHLLGSDHQDAIQALQKTPIFINWDAADGDRPLTYIRQGRRGIGDHALTIFRTHKSTVFDFSHIYFDGPWAMEVAEMLTNEATKHLQQRSLMQNTVARPPMIRSISLDLNPRFERAARKQPISINYLSGEASLSLVQLTEIRKLLISRTKPKVQLTINDLLVLFRTIFNQRYRPGVRLERALNDLRKKPDSRQLVRVVDDMLLAIREVNPSLLIPIDASRFSPKERLFPSTFRSPFPDFHMKHAEALNAYNTIKRTTFKKNDAYDRFHAARADYLSMLYTFGEIMRRYREIAVQGQSMSATAIRLIAGLPGAMQRLVDGLPGHFSFINEAIKGEEVFSNVGQVTPGSSISRFSSAKDDNDKKVMVWGVMTDNNNQIYITLRDFRPPVIALAQAGHDIVAQMIAQDMVESFAADLNEFIHEMNIIVGAPKL